MSADKEFLAEVRKSVDRRAAEAINECLTPQFLRAMARAQAPRLAARAFDRALPELPKEIIDNRAPVQTINIVSVLDAARGRVLSNQEIPSISIPAVLNREEC